MASVKQKGLLIYDNSGNVVSVMFGITTVPSGVQSMVADIPVNLKSVHIDMQTMTPIFEESRTMEDIDGDITSTEIALVEIDARLRALEG